MAALKNPKWEIAVLALIGGATQHEAYKQAGYEGSQPAANQFFKKPTVQARVLEVRQERHAMELAARQKAVEEGTVTREWIIRHLKHNALAAMRGDPVYDRKGQPTGHFKPDRGAAAKSLGLLGQAEGIFINRTEIGNPGDFSRHTDEELNKELVSLAGDLGLDEAGVVKLLEHLSAKDEED